jgi:hypothetical protein
MAERDRISLSGPETEAMLKFIFSQLPDDVVDQIELDRMTPEGGGVAHELVTTAAILSLASALSVQIFHLIGKWMEQKRQQQATLLIYQSAKENPTALKIDLEKQHTELSIKYGAIGSHILQGKETR